MRLIPTSIGVPVGTVTRNGILAHVPSQTLDISLNQFHPLFQPGEQSRVAGRGAADSLGADASQRGILLDATDDVMRVHDVTCAKRHIGTQAESVPIATLKGSTVASLQWGMATDFRNALLWHLDKHETPISDLVRATGVSRDVINKLKKRENSSTTVENAMLIASFYGKSLEQFIRCEDVSNESVLAALAEMLRPEEVEILEAQVRGILASRGSR